MELVFKATPKIKDPEANYYPDHVILYETPTGWAFAWYGDPWKGEGTLEEIAEELNYLWDYELATEFEAKLAKHQLLQGLHDELAQRSVPQLIEVWETLN
jgi:hypothetical protein